MKLILFIIVILLLAPNFVEAQMDSTNFSIDWDSISSFGTLSSSSNFSIEDTGGEQGTGNMSGASFGLSGGFEQQDGLVIIAIDCDDSIAMGSIIQDGKSNLTTNSATCHIITNNSNGYSLTLKATDPDLSSGSDTISPIATASTTPAVWDETTVSDTASGWGYRLSDLSTIDDAKWGTNDQSGVNYGTTAKWYKATDTGYQIVAAATETSNEGDNEILNFGVEIGSDKIQPTGSYSTTLTITATTL